MTADGLELTEFAAAIRLAVAALVGLVVGIEREWSGHASGPNARFAGVRTFLMFGLLGGSAGLLASWEMPIIAAMLLLGGAGFAATAYFVAVRRPQSELDGTTEAAALVVLALAFIAGTGRLALASGTIVVAVLALAEKDRLHGWVQRIDAPEMRAALQFAVLALVVLPVLPSGTYGPWGGVRPRTLWAIVVFLSGLNFVGYVARRLVGSQRGLGLTGILGGIVSSTAVTFQFARASREEEQLGPALTLGVIGACTALLPRVAVVSAILAPAVSRSLLPYLVPSFLVGLAIMAAMWRGSAKQSDSVDDTHSPLRFWSALQMAVLFQFSIMLITVTERYWGVTGVLASSAVLGLTDMDALTVSMSRLGESAGAVGLAAQGIAVGVLANSGFKLGIAVTLGRGSFRRAAGLALAALAVAAAIGLWVGARFSPLG